MKKKTLLTPESKKGFFSNGVVWGTRSTLLLRALVSIATRGPRSVRLPVVRSRLQRQPETLTAAVGQTWWSRCRRPPHRQQTHLSWDRSRPFSKLSRSGPLEHVPGVTVTSVLEEYIHTPSAQVEAGNSLATSLLKSCATYSACCSRFLVSCNFKHSRFARKKQ